MRLVSRLTRGSGLIERAARSSMLTIGSYGTSQVLRLVSNLILTRLLFPEAFGVMAMVTVVLSGLAMFSDMGVSQSIMGSKRGDEPEFLDTAWTIHVLRGFGLWGAACALAWPVSLYFGEPGLLAYLPVAGLALIVNGFNPTRIEQSKRHLRIGRITAIELGAQVTGIVLGVVFALIFKSVWALVASNVLTSVFWLGYLTFWLPGHRNRLRLERAAAGELIHFGKWIFLATVAGFIIGQADKLVLGRGLSTHDFGLYNIGYFLASFPLLLASAITTRVMIPLYRESPPSDSAENRARIARLRQYVTGSMMAAALLVGLLGTWLVGLLYDPRYQLAGAVTVLMSCMQIPAIIFVTYDQSALAAGDSRGFFRLAAIRASLTIGLIWLGFSLGGLLGALLGQGLAHLASWPTTARLARAHGAWDGRHDLRFGLAWLLLAGSVLWLHRPELAQLAAVVSR